MLPAALTVKIAGWLHIAYGVLLATFAFWMTVALRLEAAANGDLRWLLERLNANGQLAVFSAFLLGYVLAAALLLAGSGWRLLHLDARGVVLGRYAHYGLGVLYLLFINPLLATAPLWLIPLQLILSAPTFGGIALGIVGAELFYVVDLWFAHAARLFLNEGMPLQPNP